MGPQSEKEGIIPQFNYKVGQHILTNRFSVINGLPTHEPVEQELSEEKMVCKFECEIRRNFVLEYKKMVV